MHAAPSVSSHRAMSHLGSSATKPTPPVAMAATRQERPTIVTARTVSHHASKRCRSWWRCPPPANAGALVAGGAVTTRAAVTLQAADMLACTRSSDSTRKPVSNCAATSANMCCWARHELGRVAGIDSDAAAFITVTGMLRRHPVPRPCAFTTSNVEAADATMRSSQRDATHRTGLK